MTDGVVACVWAEMCSEFVGTSGQMGKKFSGDFEIKVVVVTVNYCNTIGWFGG